MLRFAQYQIRLLLCSPAVRELRAGTVRMHWECGCSASECAAKKVLLQPCTFHAPLLSQIAEDDERSFDCVSGDSVYTGYRRRVRSGEMA